MTDSRDVVAHLRYLQQMGVDGFSRDAGWRTRAAEPALSGSVSEYTQVSVSPPAR